MKDVESLDFNEIIQLVNVLENKKQDWNPLKIAFLGNITIDSIIPYLKLFCFDNGFKADIYMGNYDNVMQDVLNIDSLLYKHRPDVIVICLKIDILSEGLSRYFTAIYPDGIEKEKENLLFYIEKIFREIRKNNNAMVLIHNSEVPVYPSFGILDYQDSFKQINTYRQINLKLIDLTKKYENIFVVDIDLLQSVLGYHRFVDNRYWHIGKAPYTREALKLIAKEYIKFIKAHKGKQKKCLVVDCDNTLWGGIIGEDGIDKIEIGKTFPGSSYLEFQQALLNLYHRGVILAICSKNNEADVFDVLRNHPNMLLRETHFASIKVNWNDKVSNLRDIAEELNIGLDSIVFVDDNEFETNMVRRYLPEVFVIDLPEDITGYRDTIISSGIFDSLTFSEEDRLRGQMYREDADRKKAEAHFTDLGEYYRYLEMEITICKADNFSVPRVAQLTQRTNQFNLTTKRYSESDIRRYLSSNDYEVFYLKLKDRFGDAGIVGISILEYMKDYAVIDTFLLSCRIIGRGVEEVFLKECIKRSRKQGKKIIYGSYIKTKKNSLVAEFYKNSGFTIDSQNENETKYKFLLDRELPDSPDYFKFVETKFDGLGE